MGHKHSKVQLTSAQKIRRNSHAVYQEPETLYDITKIRGRKSAEGRIETTVPAEDTLTTEVPKSSSATSQVQRRAHPLPQSAIFDTLPTRVTATRGPLTLPAFLNRSQAQPSILFYHDTKTNQLCIYDATTGYWKKNELKIAHCQNPGFELSTNGMIVFRKEVLSCLQDSLFIPVDNNTIHVIGKIHLEYTISTNCFKLLKEKGYKFNNPTICYGANNIFFLSGDQDNEYVSSCVRYDLQKKTWITMPDIPLPHVNGSAACYYDAESDSHKIVVIGGLSSRIPTLFNYTASVYDLKTNTWETFDLSQFSEKPIKFIRSPMVHTESGNLMILQGEDVVSVYELDIKIPCLKKIQGLNPSLDLNFQRRAAFCLNEDNELVFLTKTPQVTQSLPEFGECGVMSQSKQLSLGHSIIKVNLSQNQSLTCL